jgi:hypothetical protein
MSRNINVLLIEDNPGDARLVREALKETADPCYRVEWVRRLSLGLEGHPAVLVAVRESSDMARGLRSPGCGSATTL